MEQDELLRYTVDALGSLGIRYALVGSFASGIWGETRFTQDIDILLELKADDVHPVCQLFPAEEFYVDQSAVEDAIRLGRPFNVIHPSSGNKIDFFVVAKSTWSRAQLERRRTVQFSPECTGYVAAPEDVILGKLLYYQEGGSEKHLRDVAGILLISGKLVDRKYVEEHARDLGVSAVWNLLVQRCGT